MATDTTFLVTIAPALNISEIKKENLITMVKFADRYVQCAKDERKIWDSPETFWTSDSNLVEWMKATLPSHGDALGSLANDCHRVKCQSLLKLVCSYLAHLTRNMTKEEMRKFMNVNNDFTPEEEETINKENSWTKKKK